ncbi:bestrophin-like domain [Actinacidiphila acidipaludis]|uniref:DUF4239 domain-containing protein n=1 Tax=Actinacidiphila acidipaludis TaxID=2873382 RepID=A0ABS7QI31_9ACTN|nr:hypothetical protein [Streptomyces acidipaludis]MBY8882830.1 hypothetical protein [Streptomyces acidipaludis]
MSLYAVPLLSALGGVAFAFLAGKFLGSGRRAASGEFTGQAQSLIGAVLLSSFILLTGFQVAGGWSALSSARSRTYDESRALADAYWAAGGLAPGDRSTVRDLLRQYTAAVRTIEFPDLAHGGTSTAAWQDLDRTRAAIGAASAATGARQAARSSAQDSLAVVYQTRTDRSAQAAGRMPQVTWYAMLVGGAVLIGFPALLGLAATTRQLATLCCVGAAVAFAISLAAQLDHPFQRPLGVRSTAFTLAERRFDQMDAEGYTVSAVPRP